MTTVDTSGLAFDYDSVSQTATWSFGSVQLEPSFYFFLLSSDIVTSVVGGSRLGSIVKTEAVYVALPGDANLDTRVDVLDDAFALVDNLGTTGGATWAQGDFDGDGNVTVLGDAFILVAHLGQEIVTPPPATALRG